MKLAKLGMVVVVAASAAWAQAKPAAPAQKPATGTAVSPVKGGAVSAQKPAAKPATPAAKPATAAARPAPKPATAQAHPAAPAKAPVKAAVKSPMAARKPAAKKPAAKVAAAPEMARAGNESRGKRDPFVSPIVKVSSGGPSVACNSGKRCLVANELMLRGVVKAQDGMIAVVENAAHRTYFLRENDPVYNGVVSKITGDSMVVRESTTDSVGRPMTREVVKKVTQS